MNIDIIAHIRDIPANTWNALAGTNPFMSHAFLAALQDSGCATPATGWQTQYMTVHDNNQLLGAMPLYLKHHSWGEFVFDMAWADAYRHHGLQYYPKLLCAVPFSPIAGNRILASSAAIRKQLVLAAIALTRDTGLSSFHCLFPTEAQAMEMQAAGMMLRRGVQFHWQNPGYRDFADYLGNLRHDKRKKIRQERRKVSDAGIQFERLTGNDISAADWDFFLRCYAETHRQYASPQALNRDFFLQIAATMPDNLLLVIARQGRKPVAAAFNIFNGDALYGRSWGALEYHPALHFETCYYQAIEFCIERQIPLFEGGAQGEHKLARGFLPVTTWSAHWLAHPEFAHAVEHFLQRETGGIIQYIDELNESTPFRQNSIAPMDVLIDRGK